MSENLLKALSAALQSFFPSTDAAPCPCCSHGCKRGRRPASSSTDPADTLLHQLARRDAEQVRDRCFAWLPAAQQRQLVQALTRIAHHGLVRYRARYQRHLTIAQATNGTADSATAPTDGCEAYAVFLRVPASASAGHDTHTPNQEKLS